MGFPRQEYWSGLPFPSPGDLPDAGIESTSALAGRFFTMESPGKPSYISMTLYIKQDLGTYLLRLLGKWNESQHTNLRFQVCVILFCAQLSQHLLCDLRRGPWPLWISMSKSVERSAQPSSFLLWGNDVRTSDAM